MTAVLVSSMFRLPGRQAGPPGRSPDPPTAAGTVADVCRLGLLLVIACAALTLVSLALSGGSVPAAAALLLVLQSVACLAGQFAIVRRAPAGRWVLRDPRALGLLLASTFPIVTRVDEPSAYVVVVPAICLLAGLLHGQPMRMLFAAVGVAGCWGALLAWPGTASRQDVFALLAEQPVLIALATVGGGGLRRALDRQARAEADLRERSRRLAAQDERARIAREMHDSVAKTLAGIKLMARGLALTRPADDPLTVQAAAIGDAAATGERQARALMAVLRADPADDETDLASAIAELAEAFAARSGLTIRMLAGQGGCRLGPTARHELLAILTEALENVFRHAAATTVEVALSGDEHGVELRVRDDGRGLPAGLSGPELTRAGRYGLAGMSERARLAGGSLTVAGEQPEDSGTTVVLRLPAATGARSGD